MKYFSLLQPAAWRALFLSNMVAASGFSMVATMAASMVAYGATDVAPTESTDPAELPTMVPSKQENADSAFAKLDIGKKGYLTLPDTKVLSGFERVFQTTDTDHNNRLTPEEFIPGWEAYTGIPSSPDSFQRKK